MVVNILDVLGHLFVAQTLRSFLAKGGDLVKPAKLADVFVGVRLGVDDQAGEFRGDLQIDALVGLFGRFPLGQAV